MQLLIVNGNLVTMDASRPRADAMLVEDGRIRVVGSNADARGVVTAATEIVDLRGMTVVPGFNDAHCHVLMSGMNLAQVDLKYPGVSSIAQLVQRVAARAATVPPGTWIRGFGYDQTKLAERRHPTRADLDTAAPGHPVAMSHTSGHMVVANTHALDAARIDRNTPDPVGGRIMRDDHGEATGLLQEAAQHLVKEAAPVPSTAEMRGALRLASAQLASEGITSVQDAHVGYLSPDELGAWQAASDANELTQRAYLIIGVERVYPSDRPDETPFGLGLHTGLGDERLRIGGVKIFSDGSLIGRTAAMSEPFEGEAGDRGFLTVVEEDLRRVVMDAHARGWQLSVHAIGDHAVETVLDVYEATLRAHPKADHRHRIEHAGLLTPTLIQRIARLGVIPVTQPRFISELGDGFIASVGRERVKLCYPLATLLRHGIPVAGSSDRPVVEGAPLLGIHDAVNQLTASGQPYAPEEAISAEDAIRIFTANAAHASFEERIKGTLTPGKLADFVVLGADPTQVPKAEIGRVPIVATFVNGEAIYTNGLQR